MQRPGDAGAAAAAPAATQRAPRSHRAAARHTARRDRADPVARLSLLQARRRSVRAGVDRPDLVRRGGAVRAGDPRRHILEGRHPRRRAVRAARGIRGLALHAAAAGSCAAPDGCRSVCSTQGPFGIELLKPLQLFGLDGARPDQPRDDLEHDRQRRRICRASRCPRRRAPTSTGRRALFVDVFRQPAKPAARASGAARRRCPTCTACSRAFSAPPRADDARSASTRAQAAALARRAPGRRRGARALRRGPARRRDRRRVGARHGRLGGQGGGARHRRGARNPRRSLAGRRLQPRARAEVARTGGGDRRAARGQRAAAGARPAEGRFRLDGDARAAHAADVDPRVHRRSCTTIPTSSVAQRKKFLGIITKESRATDPAHQPGARSGEDRIGQGRMGSNAGRHEGGHRGHARRDGQLFKEKNIAGRGAACPTRSRR